MLCKQLGPQNNDDLVVEDIQTVRQRLKNKHQRSQEEQLHLRRIQVQEWLCPTDSELRHKDIVRFLHPGTGEWLLRGHTFQQWSSWDYCANPLLWLSGKPGAGLWASELFIEACTDTLQGKLSLPHLLSRKYVNFQNQRSSSSTANITTNAGMDLSPLLERCCLSSWQKMTIS